jgi:LysM repeat protein
MLKKLSFLRQKAALPAIFITCASIFNLFILSGFFQPFSNNTVLGGPDQMDNNQALLSAETPIDFEPANNLEDFGGFAILDSSYVLSPGSSLSNALPTRDGLMIYRVQSGDNLSSIAANFGVSLNTIFWANPNLNKRRSIQVGQEIVILPVSGVKHEVQEGETLITIASLYNVNPDHILKYNKQIVAGRSIIIPGAKPTKKTTHYTQSKKLPRLAGHLVVPTTGWNWGQLHYNNAVDIANACNTSIYAAAEGLVVKVRSGWNGGYGNYVIIEHPNGISTRYAHLQKSTVSVGQYVVQGDQIGQMGSSGNTHGPTGCHLHFEVVGAANPFAKR